MGPQFDWRRTNNDELEDRRQYEEAGKNENEMRDVKLNEELQLETELIWL